MSVYHCGVEGPVFLDDGRVVTSDAPFQLDAASPHDEALVEEGIIVLLEDPSVEEQDKPSTADTPATSSPSTAATTKGKGA